MSSATKQLFRQAELNRFFADIHSRIETIGTLSDADSPPPSLARNELKQFFNAVSHRVELAEKQQIRHNKRWASGFNVFGLIEPDENKLSDILSGLLNPKGSHGQGDLFLRLLFKQLGIAPDAKITNGATVLREAPTHGILKYRRRLDVLVEGGVLLAIENKVDSPEQLDQVKDYLAHLLYCKRVSGKNGVLIYLTPDGRQPESLGPARSEEAEADGCMCCWSYQTDLRDWLHQCYKHCSARKIKDFLLDFIAYIQTSLKREPENNPQQEADEN